jgi:hypothetical protein
VAVSYNSVGSVIAMRNVASREGVDGVSSISAIEEVAALTLAVSLTRARGAPPRVEPPVSYTGRAAACELWGLCARPPAIGIGRGIRDGTL